MSYVSWPKMCSTVRFLFFFFGLLFVFFMTASATPSLLGVFGEIGTKRYLSLFYSFLLSFFLCLLVSVVYYGGLSDVK